MPPSPLSAPVMPTSATQLYQMSSISPSTLGGIFDDQRSLVRVEPDEAVDRVVVGGQFHGLGIDQVFPDHVGLVVGAELAQRVAHADLIHDRECPADRPAAPATGRDCRRSSRWFPRSDSRPSDAACRSTSRPCPAWRRPARSAWSSCRSAPRRRDEPAAISAPNVTTVSWLIAPSQRAGQLAPSLLSQRSLHAFAH